MKDKLSRYVKRIADELKLPVSQRPEIVIDNDMDYAGFITFKNGHFVMRLSSRLDWVEIQNTIRHELGHIKSSPNTYMHWEDEEENLLSTVAIRELNARKYECNLNHRDINTDTVFYWMVQMCREFYNTPIQFIIDYCIYVARNNDVPPKAVKLAARQTIKYFKQYKRARINY
jgi:hypothetical protein